MTKQWLLVAASLLFVAGFFVGLWPKACLDKFQTVLKKRGQDPKTRLTFSTMRALDARLYNQYLIGLMISSAFTLGFVVLMVWVMFLH